MIAIELVINFTLLGFLLVTALHISQTNRLFRAVMLFGIYSLLTASLFVSLDAVDVAFTEAAVGTGIATILMLSALSLTGSRKEVHFRRKNTAFAVCVSIALGVALAIGIMDMPQFADPNAPANLHVAPYYLQDSYSEIGIPNVVTSVLASYRGYDTLGEVVVIFTAGIGVIALLTGRSSKPKD